MQTIVAEKCVGEQWEDWVKKLRVIVGWTGLLDPSNKRPSLNIKNIKSLDIPENHTKCQSNSIREKRKSRQPLPENQQLLSVLVERAFIPIDNLPRDFSSNFSSIIWVVPSRWASAIFLVKKKNICQISIKYSRKLEWLII